jgi:hypothetical protein
MYVEEFVETKKTSDVATKMSYYEKLSMFYSHLLQFNSLKSVTILQYKHQNDKKEVLVPRTKRFF